MKSSDTGLLKRARPLLGTTVRVSLRAGPAEAAGAFQAAFQAVERVQSLMSAQDPASELSRLGRAPLGLPVPVDPWTWQVLALSLRLWHQSGGVFDPGIGSRLESHGILPRQGTG